MSRTFLTLTKPLVERVEEKSVFAAIMLLMVLLFRVNEQRKMQGDMLGMVEDHLSDNLRWWE